MAAKKSAALERAEENARRASEAADRAMVVLRAMRANAGPVYLSTCRNPGHTIRITVWDPWRASGPTILVEDSEGPTVVHGEEILSIWEKIDPWSVSPGNPRTDLYWLRDEVAPEIRSALRGWLEAHEALPYGDRTEKIRRAPRFD